MGNLIKKFTVSIPVLCLVLAFALFTGETGLSAQAKTKSITVTVNGTALKLKHKPKVVKKTLMLPAKEVFASLGGDSEWVKGDKLLLVTKTDGTLISMKMKVKKLHIANLAQKKNNTYSLKKAPQLIKGTVYVPAQVVEKAFQTKVKWNSKKKKVTITSK